MMVGAPGAPTGVTLFEAAEAAPVPIALVAVTVKVYAVPLVRPVTMIGEPGLVETMPPGDEVAVKLVIGLPPLLAGGVNGTEALELLGTAVPIVGAPGAPAGVTLFEAAEAAPVPIAFIATTVNVYAVPLVRPVTVIGEPVLVAVSPPGEEVAL